MTQPADFIESYNQALPCYERLQARSEFLLKAAAHAAGARWDRGKFKPPESILSKIEKEGFADPFKQIEDLFVATIVVPNETFILKVEREIEQHLDVVKNIVPKTRKLEEFVYDDHRLILKLRPDVEHEDSDLANLIFELQIKTEMQVAASAVSRELVYKVRTLSWSRTRMAIRVRVLVEMVDDLLIKLQQAEDNEAVEGQYQLFMNRNHIIKVLDECLAPEQMPDDRRRLAIVVEEYLGVCRPAVTVD